MILARISELALDLVLADECILRNSISQGSLGLGRLPRGGEGAHGRDDLDRLLDRLPHQHHELLEADFDSPRSALPVLFFTPE